MEEVGAGIFGWLLKLLGLAARSMVWLIGLAVPFAIAVLLASWENFGAS